MMKKLLPVVFVIAMIFFTSCEKQINEDGTKTQNNIQKDETQNKEGDVMMKKVSFQTEDGVAIVGNYWQADKTAVLLLHMMPATKESWNDFAKALQRENFTVLAIDLRGHGESTRQNTQQGIKNIDFKEFSDEGHQASIKDVEAAIEFLRQNNASAIYIAGASIGANLALWYQAEHPEIKKSIFLSAGLNYRGIETEAFAEKLDESQEVFFAAGEYDGRAGGSASDMAKQLASLIKGEKEMKIYKSSAHGTGLFSADRNLIPELTAWLKN